MSLINFIFIHEYRSYKMCCYCTCVSSSRGLLSHGSRQCHVMDDQESIQEDTDVIEDMYNYIKISCSLFRKDVSDEKLIYLYISRLNLYINFVIMFYFSNLCFSMIKKVLVTYRIQYHHLFQLLESARLYLIYIFWCIICFTFLTCISA